MPQDHAPPGTRTHTDHDLIAASLEQPGLFAEIFDRHADAVHRYLARRLGDLADDLLSETFLAAFRGRHGYRPERTDVLPWLYGIAANMVRRHHRAEGARYRALARAAHDAGAAPDEYDGVLDRVDAGTLRADLAAALAALDDRDREVLLLVAWEHLGYAEVAAVLDIPVGTVRSRLHRARRRVQDHLPATAALHRLPTGGSR